MLQPEEIFWGKQDRDKRQKSGSFCPSSDDGLLARLTGGPNAIRQITRTQYNTSKVNNGWPDQVSPPHRFGLIFSSSIQELLLPYINYSMFDMASGSNIFIIMSSPIHWRSIDLLLIDRRAAICNYMGFAAGNGATRTNMLKCDQ